MQTELRPESDIDLYCDDVLLNPYPHYRELRDLGPAVWMSRFGMFALPRFKDVKESLRNWEIFSSAHGVMMNERMNETLRGITLCTDSKEHDVLRGVIAKPLTPGAVTQLKEQIFSEAERLVERLVARKHFDAVPDLAWHLPVTIVSSLVGLPEEGRERMLDWAAANFNCFGPLNKRCLDAFETVNEMVAYAFTQAVPGKLKPGSWAAKIYEAAERGEIRLEQCPVMMNDYLGPALDTTISATGSAIMLFGQHPEQWDLVREDPSLIPAAIAEVIRLESPIQGFSRYVTQDYDIEGVTLPAGSRAIILNGSANRDERKWKDPTVFDIRRNPVDHLGFGHGPHVCVGMHLAKLEIAALLTALAKRVKRFELGRTERGLNNVIRAMRSIEVTVQ